MVVAVVVVAGAMVVAVVQEGVARGVGTPGEGRRGTIPAGGVGPVGVGEGTAGATRVMIVMTTGTSFSASLTGPAAHDLLVLLAGRGVQRQLQWQRRQPGMRCWRRRQRRTADTGGRQSQGSDK